MGESHNLGQFRLANPEGKFEYPMADPQKLSPEMVARISDELIGTPVPADDPQPVAALLRVLIREMAPMRAMNVEDAEPATTYEASPP